MFDLPGVTPPPALSNPQLPGALSLSPPENMLSWACGSWELVTFERSCQSREGGSRCSVQNVCSPSVGVFWLTSPPWRVLPGGAQLAAVVGADARSAKNAASTSARTAATRTNVRDSRPRPASENARASD